MVSLFSFFDFERRLVLWYTTAKSFAYNSKVVLSRNRLNSDTIGTLAANLAA